MNDQINKDRSPRSPSVSLEDAIALVRRLYDQIRSASVSPEVAVKPLGYSSTNGAAMTTLATLIQYGLASRTGKAVAITPLAIRILHPKSTEQLAVAIREAALTPKIMQELHAGYLDCGPEVITGHLIQNGFTPERARRVSAIHIANKSFAKLTEGGTVPADDTQDLFEPPDLAQKLKAPPIDPPAERSERDLVSLPENHKMLAQYSIPLGANQATLVFTGRELTGDDFDDLKDYIDLFKRQFERAKGAVADAKAAFAPTATNDSTPPSVEALNESMPNFLSES